MTIAEIDQILIELKNAYTAAISGKSYSVNLGGTARQVTRNDIDKLRSEIKHWEIELARTSNTFSRVKYGTGVTN